MELKLERISLIIRRWKRSIGILQFRDSCYQKNELKNESNQKQGGPI